MAVYRIVGGTKKLFADVSKIQSINGKTGSGPGKEVTLTGNDIDWSSATVGNDGLSIEEKFDEFKLSLEEAGKVETVNKIGIDASPESGFEKNITLTAANINYDSSRKISAVLDELLWMASLDAAEDMLTQDEGTGIRSHLDIIYDTSGGKLQLVGREATSDEVTADVLPMVEIASKTRLVLSEASLTLPSIGYAAVHKYSGAAWDSEGVTLGLSAPSDGEGTYLVIGYETSPSTMSYSFANLSELITVYTAGDGLKETTSAGKVVFAAKIDTNSLSNLSVSQDGILFDAPIIDLATFETKTNDGIYFISDDAEELEEEEP